MYEIRLADGPAKYYKKCSTNVVHQLNIAFEDISQSPFWGIHIKKLKGELKDKYRYRVGSFRIIYSINKEEKVIWMENIGSRGDIY